MHLNDTVALVTGGARRVGRAIALELARAGCNVAVHCRNSRDHAEALAADVARLGRRAVIIEGDLSDAQTWHAIVQAAVKPWGRLDILVNNAALFLHGKSDNLTGFDPASWERMLRINLLAPMGLAHHAAPHLRASGSGRIINLLDIAVDRPWTDHLSYVASKAGLAAMTQSLARLLAPDVCVNGVAPGVAVFPESYGESLKQRILDKIPLDRPGSPDEVARVVRFLVQSADYITGEIIRVDGGRHLV
ncbi:MAG: SDR family oxidoreductase [Phycisphaerae bacterium]